MASSKEKLPGSAFLAGPFFMREKEYGNAEDTKALPHCFPDRM